MKWIVMETVMGIANSIGSAFSGGYTYDTGVGGQATGVLDNAGAFIQADGGVWRGGQPVTAFASGGVLTGPQFFPMANGGLGLAGEAGPEAFVPLGRTREGKLGIETTGGNPYGSGGGVFIVNINNNASDQVRVSEEHGTSENGTPRLDVFIDQIDAMLAGKVKKGTSALGKSIDTTRGTNPAKAMYV